jgi:hypothetical protein
VSDIHFDQENSFNKYEPEMNGMNGVSELISTECLSAKDIIDEMEMVAELTPYVKDNITDKTTFILSMGI